MAIWCIYFALSGVPSKHPRWLTLWYQRRMRWCCCMIDSLRLSSSTLQRSGFAIREAGIFDHIQLCTLFHTRWGALSSMPDLLFLFFFTWLHGCTEFHFKISFHFTGLLYRVAVIKRFNNLTIRQTGRDMNRQWQEFNVYVQSIVILQVWFYNICQFSSVSRNERNIFSLGYIISNIYMIKTAVAPHRVPIHTGFHSSFSI